MCTKLIVCMGNSYKNGGRCLAGIEVVKSCYGYFVVKNSDGSPKWIRPVMANDNQGIPEKEVKSFGILDILKIDVIGEVPSGAHSENVRFRSIDRIGRYDGRLYDLCDNTHSLIFGNKGKAVPEEIFCNGGYSLMFVKPDNLYIETQYDNYGHEKYRIQFSYKGYKYDFPLTDPEYISKLQKRSRNGGTRNDELYLTLSLGVNYKDWHYKLVAAVVEVAA